MAEMVVPPNGIRACVREIDDAADLMGEMVWPTMDSVTMSDSAVRRVVIAEHLRAECDRLVADLRSWTATVRVAVASCEQSDLRSASTLP